MIQHLKHGNIDKTKWDACIAAAPNGNIYAFSEYLNCACESWDALVEGDYDWVMPLPYRRKFGIMYVFPPSMTQQLGVFSAHPVTESKMQQFLDALPEKFRFCRTNLNQGNVADAKQNNVTLHTNLELALNLPYDQLFGLFSENTQRNIRKAAKLNLSIQKYGDLTQLIQLFAQNKGKTLAALPDDFYEVVQKVHTLLAAKQQAEIWEVYCGEMLCGAVLFGYYQSKAYFLFSAANAKGKEVGAMPYLVDQFIRHHAASMVTLDFEGSDSPSLARFYRSFGAVEKNYQQVIVNKLPLIVNSFIKMIGKAKK
ncbi:MAG: GNAT family N-acetyltransferase [Bacteroidota bacterium]